MVTKLLRSYFGALVVEFYFKESNVSDKNWLRYRFLSYLIKIWLSVCMTPLLGLFAYYKNFNMSGMKRT